MWQSCSWVASFLEVSGHPSRWVLHQLEQETELSGHGANLALSAVQTHGSVLTVAPAAAPVYLLTDTGIRTVSVQPGHDALLCNPLPEWVLPQVGSGRNLVSYSSVPCGLLHWCLGQNRWWLTWLLCLRDILKTLKTLHEWTSVPFPLAVDAALPPVASCLLQKLLGNCCLWNLSIGEIWLGLVMGHWEDGWEQMHEEAHGCIYLFRKLKKNGLNTFFSLIFFFLFLLTM